MDPEEWRFTVIGALHPSLADHLLLEDGELVLMSAFFSNASWYAFTTRRIVGRFRGAVQSLDLSHGIRAEFGNFKGYAHGDNTRLGAVPREVATITGSDSGATLRFEYETGKPSMAPIYAAFYWERKHRFLDKLITT